MSGFSVAQYTFLYQGLPASGGSLYVYQTGTTTPITIYSDGGLTVPLSNPLTLDANGNGAFYYSGTINLKLVAYTSNGTLIQTLDPVYPVGGSQTVDITGGTIDNAVIGGVTPAAGTFTTLNANTPAENTNSTVVATTAFVQQNAQGSFLNKFRNGTFDVWQHGTSNTIVSVTPTYCADGWIITSTGANCTYGRFSPEGATPPLCLYGIEIVGAAGITDITFKQRIESYIAQSLAGQAVTVQLVCTNSTGGAIIPQLTVKHATAADNWSSTATDVNAVNLQSIANNATAILAYTFTSSSSSGNGLEITFDFGNNFSSNSKTIILSQADIRATPGATTGLNSNPPLVEMRPISIELPLNQRYFCSTFGNNVTPSQNSTLSGSLAAQAYGTTAGELYIQWNFQVQMRIPPIITTYNPSNTNANWRDVTGSGDVVVLVNPDTTTGTTGVLIGSQTTAMTAGHRFYIHATASAEL